VYNGGMGIFGNDNKPRVSAREFKDLRSRLYAKDFDEEEIDRVSMIFRADLNEPEETQAGIDEGEISRGIAWMKQNEKIHRISQRKIAELEKLLIEDL